MSVAQTNPSLAGLSASAGEHRRARVVVCDGVPLEWLAPLRTAGFELVTGPEGGWDQREWTAEAAAADALLVTVRQRVDAAILEAGAAARLKVVATIAVGVDNIDIQRAWELGIAVCNTPGALDAATADVAMLLVLSACRQAPDAERALRAGTWRGWELTGFLGKDLEGATLGLVGYGRIARALERRALGFSMHVLHHARHATGQPGYVAELDVLLAQADVVSLHVPLTDETAGLFNAARLCVMRPGSVLVNTARGAVVDEEALAQALESGHLSAAGLDVFVGEPHISPRLLAAPHLVLLPHIGSATFGARQRMTAMACHAIAQVLRGREPANSVAGVGVNGVRLQ